ncbi:hypothetical protein ACFFX0_22520 [Citricoccus parietis]|uniref:Uncharacterized protein n=1 Tax=Citricoccus parietis TaxID=592307 RepID=A0ABV5G4J3_9MICC
MLHGDRAGHAAGGDQVAGFQGVRHVGQELVRGVAVAVGQHDDRAGEQDGLAGLGGLDALVVEDLADAGHDHVAGLRGDGGAGGQVECGAVGVQGLTHEPSGVGGLDAGGQLGALVGGVGGVDDRHGAGPVRDLDGHGGPLLCFGDRPGCSAGLRNHGTNTP